MQILDRLVSRVRVALEERRAIAELSGYSDAQLRDLGILRRADIAAYVRAEGPFAPRAARVSGPPAPVIELAAYRRPACCPRGALCCPEAA